jgi:hypothetical protein
MDSIREKIIAAIAERLEDICVVNGFNTDIGQNVFRALKQVSAVPAVVVFDNAEQIIKEYKTAVHVMPVKIDAFDYIAGRNPSILGNMIFADLIEAMTGPEYKIDFDSGGPSEILPGELLTGKDSGARALIFKIDKISGEWADLDAAGFLYLRRLKGKFIAEKIKTGTHADNAKTTGALTGSRPVDIVTAGLADQIGLEVGGVETWRDPGEEALGVTATFNVHYKTLPGDPYNTI